MSAYNHYYGITEPITPPETDEIENEPEIAECECCLEPAQDFIVWNGYTVCNECCENYKENFNKIIAKIKTNGNKH